MILHYGVPSEGISLTKPLKDKNRWQIWAIIAANSVLLYVLVTATGSDTHGIGLLLANSRLLLPVGLAIVIATVLNGVLSADMS